MTEHPLIVRDSEILSGIPVVAGTRVPVRTLLAYLKAEQPLGDFLEDFPTVSREQALALLRYFTSTLGVAGEEGSNEFLESDDNPLTLLGTTIDALGLAGDVQAIPLLINALNHGDVDVRKAARWGLVRIGEPAVLPLIGVLLDAHHPWRWFAADALDRIGDARAREPFVTVLLDPSAHQYARSSAATALGRLGGDGTFELLYERLNDAAEVDVVRRGVVTGLGLLKDPRALEPLLVALASNDPGMRWDAATALGDLGDPRAVVLLIEALNDDDWQTCRCAVEALGKIGDQRAVPALRQAEERQGIHPFGVMVNVAATKALEQIRARWDK